MSKSFPGKLQTDKAKANETITASKKYLNAISTNKFKNIKLKNDFISFIFLNSMSNLIIVLAGLLKRMITDQTYPGSSLYSRRLQNLLQIYLVHLNLHILLQ
jgi:hypothetical protein